MTKQKLIIANRASSYVDLRTSLLEVDTFDCKVVQSFDQLLANFSSFKPDTIILDEALPDEGIEKGLSMLSKMCLSSNTSIYVITESREKSYHEKLLSCGAFDLLMEPFVESLILKRLSYGFEKKQGPKAKDAGRRLVQILTHDVSNLLQNCEVYFSSVDRDISTELKNKRLNRAKNTLKDVRELLRKVAQLDKDRSKILVGELKSVSLNSCIQDLVDIYHSRLEEKKINLQIDVSEVVSVQAEEISLRHQVLGNLLSNAIKFTFEGGEISIKALNLGDAVEIQVADNGVGIDDEQLSKLFSDASNSSKGTNGEKGIGFGMPLAFEFVEAFHGTLTVSSRCKKDHPNNHGTLFIIRLPKAKSQVA